MKKYLLIITVLLITALTTPMIGFSKNENNKNIVAINAKNSKVKSNNDKSFKILRKSSNQIEKISYDEYILGCVAAEMPINYEIEALKAQAVAAYTYALYKSEKSKEDYDLTDDYLTDQAYIDTETVKSKWGENYAEYTNKIKKVINDVKYEKITYKDEVILSVYHSLSSGKTVTSKEIWGKELPYLCSVDSSFDKNSPDYITKIQIAQNDLKNALKDYIKNESENAFDNVIKSKNGVVETVNIFGEEIDEKIFYELLSLCAKTYDISYENDEFTITIYGRGHGVGMSQYGANYMAKQGSSYKEILLHYYKDCKIKK